MVGVGGCRYGYSNDSVKPETNDKQLVQGWRIFH